MGFLTSNLALSTWTGSGSLALHLPAPSLSAPPSRLHLCIHSTESLSAAAAIACPTFLGMKCDSLICSGLGPLITIIAASHFSSLGISPSAHHLYEICWTRFLPASLSLLLLAPSADRETALPENKYRSRWSRYRKRTSYNTRNEIARMSIPFLLGCAGSILGCLLSYLFCWLGKDNIHRPHQRILPGRKHYFWKPGHLLLQPTEAAVAAGAVLASYIGGSMNYFATAKMIAVDQGLSADAKIGAVEVLK